MDLFGNDKLEVLDIEGNDIEELENIEYLDSLPNLKVLSLINNPISKKPEYLETV